MVHVWHEIVLTYILHKMLADIPGSNIGLLLSIFLIIISINWIIPLTTMEPRSIEFVQ